MLGKANEEENLGKEFTNDLEMNLSISFPPVFSSQHSKTVYISELCTEFRQKGKSFSFWPEEWEEGPQRIEKMAFVFSFSLQLLLQEVHSRVEILNLQCSNQRTKKGEMDSVQELVQNRMKKRTLEKGIP